jgi:glycosyltransferase XagB
MHNKKIHDSIWQLERLIPESSLRKWIAKNNLFYFRLFPLLLLFLIITAPNIVALTLYLILNIIYLLSQIFKFLLVIIGAVVHKNKYFIEPLNLPTYSILVPLYKEDLVVKKLIKSLIAIDYPTHLLEIKLLIEEDDRKTLNTIESPLLPQHFEIILVPILGPRTKPKACNYGLKFAKGKYIVVFDAEDQPDPKQLKQVVAQYANSSPEIICIQAKLNYYNRLENQLTKLFSLEYSLLYDYILIGLEKLGMPIPLGGTSNHFITKKLKEIGGWDAFNVTEDADLGIRLYNQGYRCSLINSTTLEESPIHINDWIKQRSRWIKGHILTSLLHSKKLYNPHQIQQILGIYFHLYLPNMTYILLPIYLAIQPFITEKPIFTSLFHLNILLAIILPIICSILVIKRKKWSKMKLTIILSPFYYFLFPIASIKSCIEIITKPFHWTKTHHIIAEYNNSK